jgi:nucleoside-diphosphate-sugar epimerase
VLQYYWSKKGIRSLNLRLFSPYGEKDNIKIIPLIIKKLMLWEEIGLIDQSLCFTYVDDIVDAFILALDYIPQASQYSQDINIASTSQWIPDVVEILEEISWKKLKLEWEEYKNHQEKNIFCDTELAKKVLWWEQKNTLKAGLTNTYNYYKNEIS